MARSKHHNREGIFCDPMLAGQPLVHGDNYVELSFSTLKQEPICNSQPPLVVYSAHLVPGNVRL